MPRPQVTFVQQDTPAPRPAPTATDPCFFCGPTERGPVGTPTAPVRSFAEWTRLYGGRTDSYAAMSDDVETYFQTGGRVAWTSRQVGPAPVLATATAVDGSAAATMRIDAANAGAWGNSLRYAIANATTTFTVTITSTADTTLSEVLGPFSTVTEAANTSASSPNVRLVDIGPSALLPATVAATALTSGTDDAASITNTQRQTAMDALTYGLGPGQVRMPQQTSAKSILQTHADTHNRFALPDPVDATSASSFTTEAAAARALTGADQSGFFGPWANVQGTSTTTTRAVPWGAIEAGLIAKADVITGNPNRAAAGPLYGAPGPFVLGVRATFTDTELDTLHDAGVNVARVYNNVLQTRGFRTLVSKTSSPLDYQANYARTYMAIRAQGEAALDRVLFEQLDDALEQATRDLTGILTGFESVGAIHPRVDPDTGARVDDAFRVVVEVDEDDTLIAYLSVRPHPHVEFAQLTLSRVSASQEV